MNYKSTNAEGRFTHFGGALVIGHEFGSGVEINPNSSGSAANIMPAGDETDKSLLVSGKGAGGVQIGAASTSPVTLMQRHLLQFTVPALSSAGAAGSNVDSTVTFSGMSTSEVLILQQRVVYNSTSDPAVYVTGRCSTADELRLTFWNHGPSSISGSTTSAWLLRFKF